MKCSKCGDSLLKSEEKLGECYKHRPPKALSWKEKHDLFAHQDFDESEDGPEGGAEGKPGQWGRLEEDEGMTGID